MAIVARLNKDDETQLMATAATPAAAMGFFENILSCFTPMIGHNPTHQNVSNHSEGKPSRHTVAERINDAADDDLENTKENKSLHQSGQVPMGEITAIKTISTAIIDSNKTDLKPGTVKDWAEWSLNPLLANVPMFNQYKDLTPDEYNKLLECSAILTAEDKAAAGTLTAALDKTSVHVKNFKRELVKIDPSATSSGYKVAHACHPLVGGVRPWYLPHVAHRSVQ